MNTSNSLCQMACRAALLFAVTSPALADGRVRIAHWAPFVDPIAGTSVSVAIDGTTVLQDFTFGEFVGYMTLAAGTHQIAMTPTGGSMPVISGNVSVADNMDYTLAAIGNVSQQELSLLALVDDNSASAAGNLKLRVVHTAPFANTLTATEVSVRTDAGVVFATPGVLPYRVASSVLELAGANYNFKITTSDGQANLIDLAPLNLVAGTSLTLFIVGDDINEPLAIVALPLGVLPTEMPVDDRFAGQWYNPATPGQGFGLHPVPSQDRIFATWYTFGSGGTPVWYVLDTCALPGTVSCNTVGFDGMTARFSVASISGGAFNAPGGGTPTPVGSLTMAFTSCTNASAQWTLGDQSGSFELVNLTPVDSCDN